MNNTCPHFTSLIIFILNGENSNIGASMLKSIANICFQIFTWYIVWKLHMSWQGQQSFSDGAAVLVTLLPSLTFSSLSSPLPIWNSPRV